MVKRQSQSDHDKMVEYVVNYLKEQGFWDIKADIPGYSKPEKVTWTSTGKGHIPDVTIGGPQFSLFEIETDDSINDTHTADQWKLFATHAQNNNAKFWIVVPTGLENTAEQRCEGLGIGPGIHLEVWGINV